MSQLTVAHLFDTFQSLQLRLGPRETVLFSPRRPADWVGEKLWWLSSAEGTGAGLIGADDLVTAVQGTFDSRHDRVLGTSVKGGAADRELRFDSGHRLPTPAIGANGQADDDVPDDTAELLTQGLGMALARDALGGGHWIVVVLDESGADAGPSTELLTALARLRRFLIVCCDRRELAMTSGNDHADGNGISMGAARPSRASAPRWFDRVSAEKGLAYLGPVGGVELDGLLAVLEALKAIEQPTILHLRLRRDGDATGGPRSGPAVPVATTFPEPTVLSRTPDVPTATPLPSIEWKPLDAEQVLSRQLSPVVARWAARYAEVGKRDLYLWKWCSYGVDVTTLPCVDERLRADVCDTKLLSIILCVLLDDVADEHGKGPLLESLMDVTSPRGMPRRTDGFTAKERLHAELAWDLWEFYQARARRYPRHAAFEELLRYDLIQFFNTMRYSHLVNGRLSLLNLAEHDLYSSHNMMMISFATLDLMCSPTFPERDLGRLREFMWHAQCMGRIGNLLSTWRREIAERDFTSGVFARAVSEGDLSVEQLQNAPAEHIEAAVVRGRHEEYFVRRWMDHREQLRARARRISGIDLERVIEGHHHFFRMHMENRGLI